MSTPVNLANQEAIKKLQTLINDIDMCLFCTNLKADNGVTARPMSTAQVDDDGNIWFMSPKDSDKNREIEQDNHVQLFYSHPGKSSYVVVNGTAASLYNKQKIEELWSPLNKTWFKQGKDDPNISLIKVSNIDAYYWDTTGNRMVNFFKMVASVATGKTLINAEEGALHVN